MHRITAAVSALIAAMFLLTGTAAAVTTVTPYGAGAVDDYFECGGVFGRLWCK